MIEFFNSIYFILSITMLVLAGITFLFLFFITAPYGRYVKLQDMHKHKLVSKHVGWLLMEVPAVVTILMLWALSDVGLKGILYGNIALKNFLIFSVFLLIWEFHYIYRTFIVTFLDAEVKKSFRYYVIIMGIVFNIINGLINGWYLFFQMPLKILENGEDAGMVLSQTHFFIGLIMFMVGFFIHVRSDAILREVKTAHQGKYGIPHKFLHKYVASPNYLGEIIQWIGWAILTWSFAGLVFAIFTLTNLLPRAFSNLKWYKKTFSEYPQERKAIIPFIL